MISIRTELETALQRVNKSVADIAYGYIKRDDRYYDDDIPALVWTFPPNHGYEQLAIPENILYDNGYGGQELYGVITFTDGTWLSRGEYDGSEWWEYNKLPQWADILLQITEN